MRVIHATIFELEVIKLFALGASWLEQVGGRAGKIIIFFHANSQSTVTLNPTIALYTFGGAA